MPTGRLKRHRVERETDGWTRWVQPRMDNYILVCCDCGLAHRLQFKAFRIIKRRKDGLTRVAIAPGHLVRFRAQRAPAYTRKARKNKPRPHFNPNEGFGPI